MRSSWKRYIAPKRYKTQDSIITFKVKQLSNYRYEYNYKIQNIPECGEFLFQIFSNKLISNIEKSD